MTMVSIDMHGVGGPLGGAGGSANTNQPPNEMHVAYMAVAWMDCMQKTLPNILTYVNMARVQFGMHGILVLGRSEVLTTPTSPKMKCLRVSDMAVTWAELTPVNNDKGSI